MSIETTAYFPKRKCDGCGAGMSPWKPRRRRGEQLLCDGCYTTHPKQATTMMPEMAPTVFVVHTYGTDGAPMQVRVSAYSAEQARAAAIQHGYNPVDVTEDRNPIGFHTPEQAKGGPPAGHFHGFKTAAILCHQCNRPISPMFNGGGWQHYDGNTDHKAAPIEGWNLDPSERRGLDPYPVANPQRTRVACKIPMNRHATLCLLAHDSGDGETIFHCPFCGSGAVTAGGDGTVSCDYCKTNFTVQVQPEFNAFPQTVDGQPYDVPGMPDGQSSTMPGDPNDPAAQLDPTDPTTGDPANQQAAEEAAAATEAAENDLPDFLKNSHFITRQGAALPTDAYVKHLAIAFADDPREVLADVRAANNRRA